MPEMIIAFFERAIKNMDSASRAAFGYHMVRLLEVIANKLDAHEEKIERLIGRVERLEKEEGSDGL